MIDSNDRSRRPGSKPTINDVARVAGVSKKTVSRVINRSPALNHLTRERVEQVIRELGYSPNPQARALALGRNFLIALIHDGPNSQLVLNVQQGVLDALQGSEFSMVIRPVACESAELLGDLRRFIEQQRPYGVILLPPASEDDRLARLCDEQDCRYVRLGSATLDDPDHLVASNDREAVRDALGYLLSQGHKSIGFIAGPESFRSARERRDGFEEAVRAAGLDWNSLLFARGSYTFESGYAAAKHLLAASPRPTAIFASNDEMAAGVYHAAGERRIAIPEQLSVVGFGDTQIAVRLWPPLTTVRWPVVAMGRAAACKLVGNLAASEEGQPEGSHFLASLVRRGSVSTNGQ